MLLILSQAKIKVKLQKGFTLIELMVAVLISGLVFAMLVFGMKTMINNYLALQKNQQQFKQLQLGMFDLQQDFFNVSPRKVWDENNKLLPAFKGKNDYVEMTAAEVNLVRCAFFWDKDKQALIKRTWTVLDRANAQEYKDKTVLNHVKLFNIQYLDQNLAYVNVWPENNTIMPDIPNMPASKTESVYPPAVLITLEIAGQGKISRFFLVQKNLE